MGGGVLGAVFTIIKKKILSHCHVLSLSCGLTIRQRSYCIIKEKQEKKTGRSSESCPIYIYIYKIKIIWKKGEPWVFL